MKINGLSIPHIFTDKKLNNVPFNKAARAASFADIFCNLLKEKSSTVPEPSGLHSFKDKDNNVLSIEHENHTHKYCSLCGSMLEYDGSCPICVVPTIRCGNSRAENLAIENQASSQAGIATIKTGSQISSQSGKGKK